jgi:hypothetical protein
MNPTQQTEKSQAAESAAPSLLDNITDETIRREADMVRMECFVADRRSKATGVPAPQLELKYSYGRDFGFNKAQSAEFIHLIPQGQILIPKLDYKGRMVILRNHGYNWRVVQHDDKVAEYAFYFQNEVLTKADGKPLTLRYTMEDAVKAGLVQKARGKDAKPDTKGTYDNFSQEMLMARLMTRFHKFHASDAVGSAINDLSDQLFSNVIEETEQRMGMPQRASEVAQEVVMVAEEVTQ